MSNAPQRSFARGEITPALYARSDQVAYATGLRTCRNFLVQRTGGVTNRPGTEFVDAAAGSVVRLIPFTFSNADGQAYALVFTNLLVEFVRNGAFLGAPYSVVTPYLAADLADLHVTQSADVLTIVHPSYPPATLSRLADTNWVYATITFAPSVAAPINVVKNPITPPGTFNQWVVTAVDATTGVESVASASVGRASIDLPIARTITWDAVPNAASYNVYKGGTPDGSIAVDFGFIGSSGQVTAFFDDNLTPDMQNRATIARNPFGVADSYPATVNYYQSRQVFGGSVTDPQTVYTSRTGDYQNLTVSSPTQDNDAITFGLASKKVNTIRHLLDTGTELVVLTSGAEWSVDGDAAGVLRPTDINARCISQHGSSTLAPLQLDKRVLYVHARESVVRDLLSIPYQGFRGTDLTIFSSHLFQGRTIVDWCYQELPSSIVWVVLDDGSFLSLTDVAEQDVLGWARHDTEGTVLACCAVPEGAEDRVYLAVSRNGATVIERMASRFFEDIQDAIFTDSTLTYDGRNTDTLKSMRLSGGTDWSFDEILTCTCSASEFVAGDVGNAVLFTADDGLPLLFTIAGYTSPTVVTGFPNRTVPADMQGTSTSVWARAVDTVTGLDHLNGLAVSVTADAYVVANPNNPLIADVLTVSGGSVTMDRPYAYIHVGLPYVSDLETLDVETPSGPSLKGQTMKIDRISAVVQKSRGLYVGSGVPADDSTIAPLHEWKLRDDEEWGTPVTQITGTLGPMNITNKWSYEGRIFLRQVDPMPCTILAVIPQGALV